MMKYSSKKKHLFFILTILSAVLSLVGMVAILTTPLGEYQFLYIFIVLIIGLLLMNKFRYQLDQEIYLEQYYLLFKSKALPYTITEPLLTDKWIQTLTQKGYKLYKDYTKVSYYYRINQVSAKHKPPKTLVLLILIHDLEIKYNSNLIVQHINELEDSLRKKERYRQRIFIHIKSFKTENPPAIQATEQIFWIRKSTENIVSLHLSYFEKEKSIYYVHNPSYTPNQYYKYAVDAIENILP